VTGAGAVRHLLTRLARGSGGGRKRPTSLWVAGGLLLALLLACGVGPLLVADPTEIVDPSAAALLPPGSVRWVVSLQDAPTMVAESAVRDGASWCVSRLGQTTTIPAGRVTGVSRRSYLLGTDTVGRDVLSRVLSGGRVSLGIGALGLVVALVLGVLVGLAAGLGGRLVDGVLMRLLDAALAVPMLFLLILLASVLRPSAATLAVVLGLSSWMGVARLLRGQVKSLKERDFILAARAIGASGTRIAFRHILPNAATPLSQDAALRLGDLILVEAAVSFLGLGVQPPTASWGNLIGEGQTVIAQAWWLTAIPAALIALTVIAAALAADAIQSLTRGE
jgi:peptide/nickel transport system permease protein